MPRTISSDVADAAAARAAARARPETTEVDDEHVPHEQVVKAYTKLEIR